MTSFSVANPPTLPRQTTTGREFIFSFLKLYREHVKLYVYLTNQNSEWTTIVVNVPSVRYKITSLLEKGETRKINLPSDAQPLSDDLHNNTVIVTADNAISVYGFMYSGDSAGGFLVLPTSVLGRDYYAASYQPARDEWSQVAITSLADDTVITIVFRATVSYKNQHYQPGNRITKILNRRESILIKSHEDLTGTHIQSSKPISVVSGVSGAIVPKYMQTKDAMVTHLMATNTWGTSFIIPPLPNRRSGYRFRVIASCPITTITSSDSQIATLMKPGDFYENGEQKSVMIESTKPIMVIQYANSQAFIEGSKPRSDGDGDTLMLVIPPWEMNPTKNITFTGVQLIGTQSFRSHVSVTAMCSAFRTLRLNGEPIEGTVTHFGNRICTKQAQLKPLMSSFSVTSNMVKSKYIVVVYGSALEISYAYPAGFTLHQQNCDGMLSNDASNEPTCCEEAEYESDFGSVNSLPSSYSSNSYSNSDPPEDSSDFAGSASESAEITDPSKLDIRLSSFESTSEEVESSKPETVVEPSKTQKPPKPEVEPSKPDAPMSSFPALNDGPGSSENNNEVNPTSQRSEDPQFVMDKNRYNSATCLKSTGKLTLIVRKYFHGL